MAVAASIMQATDELAGSANVDAQMTAVSRSYGSGVDRSQDRSQEQNGPSQLLQIGPLVSRLHAMKCQSLAKSDDAVMRP